MESLKVLSAVILYVAVAAASPLLAPAYAGYGHPGSIAVASPAITSQSSNILRTFGNLGQVSTHSKTIDTPYSSVAKSDIRVSNPGLAVAHGYPAVAAHGYAPAIAAHGYAPAIAAHGYAAPAFAPRPFIAPGYAPRPAIAAVPHAAAGLLGVAYSPATSVSHMTYSAPAIGLNYAW